MSEHWVRVAEFSLGENLTALDQRLKQLNILHRITEEGGKQLLWVASRHDVEHIKSIIEEKDTLRSSEGPASHSTGLDFSMLRSAPVTLLIILLGAVGFALVYFGVASIGKLLLFAHFDTMIAQGSYWRIVTPAFLHFGVMHFVFNALWIWVAGQRLEAFLNWKVYLSLFLVAASASNIFQYLAIKQLGFGGLSGVVYAYLACVFVLHKKYPSPGLFLPPGIYGFMLFWLVLGFSGFIDNFIQGQVANWAHLGGLLAGLVFAFCYVTIKEYYEHR